LTLMAGMWLLAKSMGTTGRPGRRRCATPCRWR